MSAKFIIPLQEIDKAIRINCHIDNNALKPLTLVREKKNNNAGIGRALFIFVALKVGYNEEQICDYLAITPTEYNSKTATLSHYFNTGRILFTKKTASFGESDDSCLLFYRKLLLVGNYLRYRYDFEI